MANYKKNVMFYLVVTSKYLTDISRRLIMLKPHLYFSALAWCKAKLLLKQIY